jgi:uncharacterized protein
MSSMTTTTPPQSAIFESTDGRSFTLLVPAHVAPPGELVDISGEGVDVVGYVEQVGEEDATGARRIFGRIISAADEPVRMATEVTATPARAETVTQMLGGPDPRLHMGRAVGSGAPVGLLARKINRHTFWCGQSGSGKTYALGVALERILSATRLPILVLDPNSDYVGLGDVRPEADPRDAAALASKEVVVLRPHDAESPLRVRFRDMDPHAKAAVLRLDPIADRAEYNALLRLASVLTGGDLDDVAAQLQSLEDPDAQILAQRIENLGVLEWAHTWAGTSTCATETIARRPDAVVLDVGGYDRHEEQLAVALAVLDDLWARRAERRPVLIVLDEAHNFCPPTAETPLGVAVRDRLVQIAAEGRKYGLWLLLSTQRPSKIHPGVLTQCDNLTLMRMNSPADLAELADVFGFVPRQLLERAARFIQGEALLAGGFVPLPTVVRMRDRVTPEGGVDVPVPMVEPDPTRSPG